MFSVLVHNQGRKPEVKSHNLFLLLVLVTVGFLLELVSNQNMSSIVWGLLVVILQNTRPFINLVAAKKKTKKTNKQKNLQKTTNKQIKQTKIYKKKRRTYKLSTVDHIFKSDHKKHLLEYSIDLKYLSNIMMCEKASIIYIQNIHI